MSGRRWLLVCGCAWGWAGPAWGLEALPPLPSLALGLDRQSGSAAEPGWAGEELEYRIEWGGIMAGRALLRVLRKNTAEPPAPATWKVRLDVRSSRLLAWFYPVRDKAESEIDVQDGFSRSFSLLVREGRYRAKENILFDYDLDKLEARCGYERSTGEWGEQLLPLAGKVLDPLAAVYYLRACSWRARIEELERLDASLAAGALAPEDYQRQRERLVLLLPVCAERMLWAVRLVPLRRETVRLGMPARPRRCWVVRPEYEFQGLFARKGEVTVWLHAASGLPVKMEAETPLGRCVATLDAWRNPPPAFQAPEEEPRVETNPGP